MSGHKPPCRKRFSKRQSWGSTVNPRTLNKLPYSHPPTLGTSSCSSRYSASLGPRKAHLIICEFPKPSLLIYCKGYLSSTPFPQLLHNLNSAPGLPHHKSEDSPLPLLAWKISFL